MTSRYSSLASLVATLAVVLYYLLLGQAGLLFILIMSILIFGKHHGNIRRLIAGEESKIGAHPQPSRPAGPDAARASRRRRCRRPRSTLPAARVPARLIRSDHVGPVTFRELINHFGGAEAALAALPELSRRGGRQAIRICLREAAEAELEAAHRIGARPLHHRARLPSRPCRRCAAAAALRQGRHRPPDAPIVAIVGACNASAAGQKLARMFAASIGPRGLRHRPGLARGIDRAAHEAALQHGTIAVLAGGLDNVYPPEHAELQAQIGERGCLISENARASRRAPRTSRRNRIISGSPWAC